MFKGFGWWHGWNGTLNQANSGAKGRPTESTAGLRGAVADLFVQANNVTQPSQISAHKLQLAPETNPPKKNTLIELDQGMPTRANNLLHLKRAQRFGFVAGSVCVRSSTRVMSSSNSKGSKSRPSSSASEPMQFPASKWERCCRVA